MTSLYGLTLTLKPKLYTLTVEQQYDLAKPIITNLGDIGKITCVTEFTLNYNVHFHMMLECDRSKQPIGDKGRPISFERYVHDRFRKSDVIGFIRLKRVTDNQGWKEYIGKNIQATKSDIARRVVVMDDFNIFNVFD